MLVDVISPLYYNKSFKKPWTGRVDGPHPQRIHEVIRHLDLNNPESRCLPSSLGILGFACDEGVKRNQGRTGAKEGPQAFRGAFASLPFHNLMFSSFYDCGDISAGQDLAEAQSALGYYVERALSKGLFPLVIGGGHEVAFGNFQGLAKAYPSSSITVVNFDAHFDLRPVLTDGQGSSGTSFTQIANYAKNLGQPFSYFCMGIQRAGNTAELFSRASEMNVSFLTAEEMIFSCEAIDRFTDHIIQNADKIYCTICLDVFSSSIAPGVSAPQPLGIFPWHVLRSLKAIVKSGKLIGLDIAELNPQCDIDQCTAKLAAHMVANGFSLF